jgi:NTE family protein
MALRTPTADEADRRAAIASRLPVREWPATALRLTAIDAASGEFVVFDRDSGVPLVDAVAASCAVPGVWPPVTIGGRRFIDGGMRSAANADLAEGAERAVVLAPITRGGGPMPKVATDVAALAPMPVALVSPDAASTAAFGRNPLDPAVRAPAARAGFAQAAAEAERVRAAWTP